MDEGAAAGKRDEAESDAFDLEVGVLAGGAPGTRFKLDELRLLPRDRASTRPSTLTLWMELEWWWWWWWADGGFLVSLRRCEVPEEVVFGLSMSRHKILGRQNNNNKKFNTYVGAGQSDLGGWGN